eukprot:8086-Heterococcus_DN1.PRE.4
MKDSNNIESCAYSSSAGLAKRRRHKPQSSAQELPHDHSSKKRLRGIVVEDCQVTNATLASEHQSIDSSKKRVRGIVVEHCEVKSTAAPEHQSSRSSSSKKRHRQESAAQPIASSNSSSSSKPVAAAAAAAAMDDIFGDVKVLKAAKAREEEERLAAKAAARAERKRREVNPFAEGGGSLGGGAEPDAADRWGWANSVKPVRHDAEGLPIYSWDALRIGQGGGTDLCPFDCDCCF